jgi:hydrogenase maturation protease
MSRTAGPTTVVGIGNPYRRDDGLGSAVIDRLRARLRDYQRNHNLHDHNLHDHNDGAVEVVLAESDGEPTRLLDLWQGASRAVIVDAVRTATSSPVAGRVYRRSLRHPSMDATAGVGHGADTAQGAGMAYGAGAAASSHGVDVGSAMALAAALDMLPMTVLLYAVEVTDTSPGQGLSPAVAAAADKVAEEIATLLWADSYS